MSGIFRTFASLNNKTIKIMDYEMKKLGNNFPSNDALISMYRTIMGYIKGVGNMFAMTEL